MSPKSNASWASGVTLLFLLSLLLPAVGNATFTENIYPSYDNFWTGHVMNSSGSYSKHNADMLYGKGPPDSKWQGWTKIDLSGVPHNAVIVSTSFRYFVVSQSDPPPATSITHVACDPETADAATIWNDITTGTVISPESTTGDGWVERPLNDAGVAALQASLAQDWMAIGICKLDTVESKGHAKGYEVVKFRPHFEVTFSAADMGIDEIIAPVGVFEIRESIVPTVAVYNRGDTDEPFRLWLAIGDRRDEFYRRTELLPGLAPGESTVVTFPVWVADTVGGQRTVRCSLELAYDAFPADNYAVEWFFVARDTAEPRPRWGWEEVDALPYGGQLRPVRHGAWLAVDPTTGLIYACRGNRTNDFYSYDPLTGNWQPLAPVPGLKYPGRGARAVADGKGSVYMVKGKGTFEFWRYDIGLNQWTLLPSVPEGPSGKKVKGGSALLHTFQYGLNFIHLLKGPKQDFLRYNVEARAWDTLENAPAGQKANYKRGSWVVYDRGTRLYVHKARYHEIWTYDIYRDSWQGPLPGIPYTSPSQPSRRRRSGDGGSAVWRENGIYALKGGNTDQFWRYDVARNEWTEREPMPDFGTTLKRKRVSRGGSLVSYPYSRVLYALKGNKTYEFWRYVMPPRGTLSDYRPRGPSISSSSQNPVAAWLTLSPNPARPGNPVSLQYAVPARGPARLSVFDALGRVAARQTLVLDRSGRAALNTAHLAAGAYFVRLSGADFDLTRRLVLSR